MTIALAFSQTHILRVQFPQDFEMPLFKLPIKRGKVNVRFLAVFGILVRRADTGEL